MFFLFTPFGHGHTQPVNLITDTSLFETALQKFFWIWRTCETSCTNVNTPRYPLGTSVNTTYIQVPSLEFGHSDGDRVQGQVQCRGPDTTRTQKWVPGTSLCHCVHEIFFSSGGVRIHCFMHDVKFMFQNGVWQGEME